MHAAALLEDGAGPEEGDAGRHRLDGADRIGILAAALQREVEYLEGERGKQSRHQCDENVGAEPCRTRFRTTLEADDGAEAGREQQADEDDLDGGMGGFEADQAKVHGWARV
jgi:hypothetical protein